MLNWKQIGPEDLALLAAYRPYSDGISDYSPTSLLCYARGMDIRYARLKDALLLKYLEYDGLEYALMPMNAGDGEVQALAEDFAAREIPLRFDLLSQRAAEQIKQVLGISLTRLTDCFDYLYTLENLTLLPGSEHATDRNKLSRLLRTHRVSFHSYTPADREAVLDFAHTWVRDYVKPVYKYQFFAQAELQGIETLTAVWNRLPSTKGGVLTVDGAIAGFAFGDWLDSEVCTLHNVKIRRDLAGVQLALMKNLLEQEFSQFRYMNFEDDMGQPGLRTAKQRLRPCRLLYKYSTGEYETATWQEKG